MGPGWISWAHGSGSSPAHWDCALCPPPPQPPTAFVFTRAIALSIDFRIGTTTSRQTETLPSSDSTVEYSSSRSVTERRTHKSQRASGLCRWRRKKEEEEEI